MDKVVKQSIFDLIHSLIVQKNRANSEESALIILEITLVEPIAFFFPVNDFEILNH